MFNNYAKKFSLQSYGGINWDYVTGFEQVINNGVATYYVIEWTTSRVVIFNQNWIYQSYQSVPYPYSWVLKYVNGYFYISSNDYFSKSNLNFTSVNSFYRYNAAYGQIFYNDYKLYVASYRAFLIDIFDTSCSLLQTVSLMGNKYRPSGALDFFNGNVYYGLWNYNQIDVLQSNFSIIKNFTVCASKYSYISDITFDKFGYLAVSCNLDNSVNLYDYNGNSMNTSIPTTYGPFTTAIDSKGRLVLITHNSVDIYY